MRIDLRALWAAVYRHRFFVAAIVAVAVALGVTATFLATPIFSSTATIQIDLQAAKILGENSEIEQAGSAQGNDRFLQTQIDVLESRSLAQRVAENLGFLQNPVPFLEQMNMVPAEGPQGPYDMGQARQEQVIDALQDNLRTDLPVESSVAEVTFLSPDRQLSARVANAFADNFIISNLQRKFNTSAYARQFLEEQLAETRQKLEESERALIDYARSTGLLDTSAGGQDAQGSRSLTVSSLVQINQAYSQAISERLAAEQRWRQASSTPLMSLPEVLASPAIQTLVQERARLQAEYENNAERYRADFPVMVQLRAQIDALNEQINRLASSIRDGIRQRYQVAASQEGALQNELDSLKSTALGEQDRSVRYNILRREVDTNRAQYDSFLQRYKEVSAAAGLAANNVSIVDRAQPSIAPVSPRPMVNLAASIVLGLLCGVGFVALREHFDDAIRSGDDVERKLGMPLAGLVPNLRSGQDPQEELGDKKSELSEAYAALRSTLLLATPSGPPRSLLFTSAGPAEGKSTSSYAIARSFAQIGHSVVLIDADMRRPSQHKKFNVSNKKGLVNLLTSQSTIDQVVVRSEVPNLSFIPAGPIPVNPAELISGPLIDDLIAKLKAEFEIVIVDAPPVLGLADAPALASKIDSTIFVVEANKVAGRRAKDALQRILQARGRVLGVLLSKFDARALGYTSEYGYLYNYSKDEKPE
ncbi:GumC family protein [Sphingosinithalassobacter sp. LHW66-3]|uniref:GumC family protein n=1 Tax=Sphingosinithalassobacter sp. LHW66-3 TaxID=3424718 RepID=UPI003D6C524A